MKLPANIFSESLQDSKATNNALLILLKLLENVELDGKYEHLAPVLFTDPHDMTSDTLFKSMVLVKVSCHVLFLYFDSVTLLIDGTSSV